MIIFIVAHDKNRGIGFKGRVPWPRMKADRERLHELTSGKVLAMGRKSHDEFNSVKHAFSPKEVLLISRLESVGGSKTVTIDQVKDRAKTEDIWVLGGGQIFQKLLPDASKIYLTEIEGSFEADCFFPELDSRDWDVIESQSYQKDEENPCPYTFKLLERRV